VPHLTGRLGTTGAGLAVGVIWAVWHYPILLGAGYNAGTDPVYAVACFTIMVIAMGIAQAWLRVWSGSVWPCVLVHASHNTLVQGVLDAMTSKSGKAPYITTEFGAGMAVTLTLVAGVMVMRGRNLRPR
jgi:membrane protease YdiL (CAAX protease family)